MSTFKKVILSTEYCKESIRGPDYLQKFFEHMMRTINAAAASAFADCYQDKERRITGMEFEWCVDIGPRNLHGEIGYWKIIATIEAPDEKP
jgi:hypothetical protein